MTVMILSLLMVSIPPLYSEGILTIYQIAPNVLRSEKRQRELRILEYFKSLSEIKSR